MSTPAELRGKGVFAEVASMRAAEAPVSVVLGTTNGQTLTVVRDADSGAATLRVAKDGHNRAVAKLDSDTVGALFTFLASH